MQPRDAEELMAAALCGEESALDNIPLKPEELAQWRRAAAVYRRKREMNSKQIKPVSKPFLTAKWQYLAMLNYQVTPELLQPYVPDGTELDQFGGVTYLSLVCFRFIDTRVLGIPVPFHRNFEEINLRFYVKRRVDNEIRRGVVFIKEIVPKPAITAVARLVYNEQYETHPTGYTATLSDAKNPLSIRKLSYWWGRQPIKLDLEVSGEPKDLIDHSEEEFITEHYWGYTRQRNRSTLEYQVAHPRWQIWNVDSYSLKGQYSSVYEAQFAQVLATQPSSVFLAVGSEVTVFRGVRVKP